MKRIITLISLFILVLNVSAQDDHRGYIGIGIGPSIALSDFASTNSNNDDAGYALTGGNLNISFAYRLGAHLGLTAMITGTSNPIDEGAVEQDFRDAAPNVTWNVEADRWRIGGLMIGGFATFSAGDRGAFDIRLLGGVLNATMPEARATASSGVVAATAVREEKTASTGAVDLGFLYRHRIGDSFCIMGGLDFISANPKFENVTTRTPFGDDTRDVDLNYSTVNITIGIGFLLN